MVSNRIAEYHRSFREERKKSGTVDIPEKIKFFKDKTGTGKKVVDLGCRFGDLTAIFMEDNEVIGFDVDDGALEICNEKYGFETHWQDLSEELPLEDESVDVVILNEVLEHLPYPDLVVSEIYRVLKKDGLFLGSVPNACRLKNRLNFLTKGDGKIDGDPTHLHYFSEKNIRELLKDFNNFEFIYLRSRFLFLSEKMFAYYFAWSCKK
jgi:SAM-dependent methyltransferase